MTWFLEFPHNYQQGATTNQTNASWASPENAFQVSDGRNDTALSTTADDVYLEFNLMTTRSVDAYFMRTTGVDHVTITSSQPSARTLVTRYALPDETTGTPPVSYTQNGILHSYVSHLHSVPFNLQQNVQNVRMHFEGTNIVIYNVLITDLIAPVFNYGSSTTFPPWTDVSPQRVDRSAVTRTNIRGELITTRSRAERWKWLTAYTGIFDADRQPQAMQLMNLFDTRQHFTIYPNPVDFPTVWYPATLDGSNYQIEYVGQLFTQQRISFTIAEM